MGMGVRSAMGWEWDGNGNEVIEMGGNWYEKSVPAHLYSLLHYLMKYFGTFLLRSIPDAYAFTSTAGLLQWH